MKAGAQIQCLSRDEIDAGKWDTCIASAPNGLVYASSTYLDCMSAQWNGLVLGDYECVMPLTWNRKYGIAYLYQPFLTAQLGVFGRDVTADLVEHFLEAIPTRFLYWDFYLNHQNAFHLKKFHLYQRSNIRRNIRKAQQLGCTPVKDIEVGRVIELATAQMKEKAGIITDNMTRFKNLYDILYKRQQAITYGIISAKQELLASCVFFFSHDRAYYILVGNHPDGRTLGASHALIDAFVKDHAGKNLLLDFEGSDIRNLAFFYSSFGAIEEKYAGIKLNKLPFYLKWLKK